MSVSCVCFSYSSPAAMTGVFYSCEGRRRSLQNQHNIMYYTQTHWDQLALREVYFWFVRHFCCVLYQRLSDSLFTYR